MRFLKAPETINRRLFKQVVRSNNSSVPYLYLNKPKCASSTIKRALAQAGRENESDSLNPHSIEPTFKRALLNTFFESDLEKVMEMPDETFVFTFVRNPFVRVFSCYRDKCLPKPGQNIIGALRDIGVGRKLVSFGDFLSLIVGQKDSQRNGHWRTMVGLHMLDNIEVDFVGSVEELENDMRFVFSKIFPECRLDLKNRNSRAERADIRDAFGSEEVEKVLEIYAKDFEYFGYDTDPALMTKAPTKP